MKNCFIVLFFLFFITTLPLKPQGFDWQYSPRMPAAYPDYYIGINGEVNFLQHEGKIHFFENMVMCESFRSGKGSGVNLGFAAEYWSSGSIAFFGKIAWVDAPGEFKIKSVLPRVTSDFISEYSFSTSLKFVAAGAGTKWRLFGSHFFAAALVNMQFLVSNSNIYKEKILSPNDYFSTEPPTQERTIAEGRISSFQNFQFSPHIRIGYDAQLGKSTYTSLYFSAGIPLTNLIDNEDWKIWSFSLGINIFRGFNF